MTDSGCGRVRRQAEEVETVCLESGSVTWSVHALGVPWFAGGAKFCAHVPPHIKNRAGTACVKVIAAMIPKTPPLFCNSNPKYNRDFSKA